MLVSPGSGETGNRECGEAGKLGNWQMGKLGNGETGKPGSLTVLGETPKTSAAASPDDDRRVKCFC